LAVHERSPDSADDPDRHPRRGEAVLRKIVLRLNLLHFKQPSCGSDCESLFSAHLIYVACV
jgi:hypothetical protein